MSLVGNKLFNDISNELHWIESRLPNNAYIYKNNIFSQIVDLLVQVFLLTQTDEKKKQSVKPAFVKHL